MVGAAIMQIAGVAIILVAAVIETVAGVLFAIDTLSPNPHMPFAMFSGVAFAVGGLALYRAGR